MMTFALLMAPAIAACLLIMVIFYFRRSPLAGICGLVALIASALLVAVVGK